MQRVHFGGPYDPVASVLLPAWQYYKYLLPVDEGYEYAPAVVIAIVRLLQPKLEEAEDRANKEKEESWADGYESGLSHGRATS